MEENKSLLEIRKNQLLQIKMIRLFTELCTKENLIYYMIGGTMLGAVRHKGFIPWDDDADFGMLRSDYEKFLLVAPKYMPEGISVESSQYDGEYPYYFSRLSSSEKKICVKIGSTNRIESVWIDIFPLDGIPDNKIMRYIHTIRLLKCRLLYQFSRFNVYVNFSRVNRVWYERFLIFCGKHLPVEKMFSKETEWLKMDRALKKYPPEKMKWIINAWGYKFKDIFKKEIFGDGVFYEFEGMQLRGPRDYNTYLTQLYGDYMTPPPEAERNKHSTEIVEKSEESEEMNS